MTAPTHLVVDIETAPALPGWAQDRATSKVHPPGNITKPESIEKWWANQSEEAKHDAIARTALNGTYGQVAAIGWQFWPGGETSVLERIHERPEDEKQILGEFFRFIRAGCIGPNGRAFRPRWTGYNLAGFDLRFLWQRATVHGVEMGVHMPVFEKPWSNKLLDLMVLWGGTSRSDWVRKEDVAQALGIAIPKDAITGAEIGALWAAGDYAAIGRHCRQDVELTTAILERVLEARP